MAKKFWNGKSWRRISDAEAQLREKLGQKVVDKDDAKASPPAPPPPAKPPVPPPAPPPAPEHKPEPAKLPPPPAPPTHATTPAAPIALEFKKSQNLRSAELGADGVLLVTFADGKHYAYANFTPELMAQWEAAQSAGGWFHQNVRQKPHQHPVIGTPKTEAPKG